MNQPTKAQRILGGLYGSLVGDALGVPVEFYNRFVRVADPVVGMRGHGTHNQPAGTWSDDGSLLLCAVESLTESGFNIQDMGERFVRWFDDSHWSAHGEVFDIGNTTSKALHGIAQGTPAEEAGGDGLHDNGNGSLMRILPVVLATLNDDETAFCDQLQRASAITHGHERSKLACVFFGLYVRSLMLGNKPTDALQSARELFVRRYQHLDLMAFQNVLSADIANWKIDSVTSGGYVMETLTASIWCLLTTDNFSDCVLKAVNLGGDTDTTGCVAGGLAGVYYGLEAIPQEWLGALPKQAELNALFAKFVSCLGTCPLLKKSNTMNSPTVRPPADSNLQRALLSLNGLSVGDALGQLLSTCARTARAVVERDGLPGPHWWHTDDTQMGMAIVEELAVARKIVQATLVQRFARRFADDPGRGYGKGARMQLEQIARGASWRVTSAQAFNGRGSMGNGSAMRAGPLGAYFATDLDLVVSQAKLAAMVTHAHPEGIAGGVAIALAAAAAWNARGLEPEEARALLWSTVLERTPAGETLDAIHKARQLPLDTAPADAARTLGSGFLVTAPDTVPFALWCATRHLADYPEAMFTTLEGDGDCDTNCAIVGSIVALFVGAAGIPLLWLESREPLDLQITKPI